VQKEIRLKWGGGGGKERKRGFFRYINKMPARKKWSNNNLVREERGMITGEGHDRENRGKVKPGMRTANRLERRSNRSY